MRAEWLAAASSSERVEHIFSSDADDEISQSLSEIRAGVVNPRMQGVSAVRNWNAAAAAARGDLLVVIADDLLPCARWDALLDEVLVDLDPLLTPFVVKIAESDSHRDLLLRHPVVSRAYYNRFGLWNPEYQGHYVDHDFTYAAYNHGLVLDGRRVRLTHMNAAYGHSATRTESQVRMMSESATDGRALFARHWPLWRRRSTKRYFRPKPGQTRIHEGKRLFRIGIAKLGYLKAIVPHRMRHLAQRHRGKAAAKG